MVDPTNFSPDAPGQLLAITGGYSAFLPNPLPPDIEYEARIVRPLEDATLALGQLKGLGHMLPNPHMLIRVFQQREALLSSHIEGTVADPQELLIAEVDRTKTPGENVREDRNYVDALNFGLKQLEKLPVCLRLIRDAHRRLMQG